MEEFECLVRCVVESENVWCELVECNVEFLKQQEVWFEIMEKCSLFFEVKVQCDVCCVVEEDLRIVCECFEEE